MKKLEFGVLYTDVVTKETGMYLSDEYGTYFDIPDRVRLSVLGNEHQLRLSTIKEQRDWYRAKWQGAR